MRRQESAAELEGGLSLFKCVEPERLEQLETERPGVEAEERELPPATGYVFCHLNLSLAQHLTQIPQ